MLTSNVSGKLMHINIQYTIQRLKKNEVALFAIPLSEHAQCQDPETV